MNIFGPDPTPEQIEEYQRAQEEARMKSEAFRHEVQQWLDELGPRHTFLLKSLLLACHDDNCYIMRQVGEADGRMKYLHHVDPSTGLPEGTEFFSEPPTLKDNGENES